MKRKLILRIVQVSQEVKSNSSDATVLSLLILNDYNVLAVHRAYAPSVCVTLKSLSSNSPPKNKGPSVFCFIPMKKRLFLCLTEQKLGSSTTCVTLIQETGVHFQFFLPVL